MPCKLLNNSTFYHLKSLIALPIQMIRPANPDDSYFGGCQPPPPPPHYPPQVSPLGIVMGDISIFPLCFDVVNRIHDSVGKNRPRDCQLIITRKYMHAETLALLTKPSCFPNMKYCDGNTIILRIVLRLKNPYTFNYKMINFPYIYMLGMLLYVI